LLIVSRDGAEVTSTDYRALLQPTKANERIRNLVHSRTIVWWYGQTDWQTDGRTELPYHYA